VYVPTDDRTHPSPHLAHIEDRDIETTSDKQLTLMNPADMIRQMMDEFGEMYGVQGRITSLDPLRKENAPDGIPLPRPRGIPFGSEVPQEEGQEEKVTQRKTVTLRSGRPPGSPARHIPADAIILQSP
jgi:hypothetical protein